MISHNEYKYYKSRIEKLEEKLFDFENTSPLYRMFEIFISLDAVKQQELRNKWNQYYEDVQKTDIYKNFKGAKAALMQGNLPRLKTHIEISKGMNNFLKKPSTEDPDLLKGKLESYWEMKKKASKYREIVEEYDDVYESKKVASFQAL